MVPLKHFISPGSHRGNVKALKNPKCIKAADVMNEVSQNFLVVVFWQMVWMIGKHGPWIHSVSKMCVKNSQISINTEIFLKERCNLKDFLFVKGFSSLSLILPSIV